MKCKRKRTKQKHLKNKHRCKEIKNAHKIIRLCRHLRGDHADAGNYKNINNDINSTYEYCRFLFQRHISQ